MILIDTHIWIWWVGRSPSLSEAHLNYLKKQAPSTIAIPKPNRFSGVLTNVIFFFIKAKKSIIALATGSFFNADKGKKNQTKNRKAIRLGYVSVISCWEVAKLVELGRLQFNISVEQWLEDAIAAYNVSIIPLDIPIVVESTTLPGSFHKDPADQLIVATARVHNIALLTADSKILNYPSVKLCNL